MSDAEGERPITAEWVLELLVSRLKLDRERGVVKLEKLLKIWDKPTDDVTREESVSGKQRLQSEILEGLLADEDDTHESRPSSSGAVSDDEQTDGSRPVSRSNSISEDPHHYYQWERKYICLMACYPLISFSTANDKDFLLNVRDISIKLLTHPRVRVQLAAGGVLGFMSKYAGPSVYEASREIVLGLVTEHLNIVCVIPEEDELKSVEQGFDVRLPAVVIRQKVIKESLGWNHLEPSLKCLQFMIENLESEFSTFMEPRLINLIFQCLSHPVRYVRETGFQICTALMVAAPEDMKEVAHQMSRHLAAGLSDNWNQVRLAAAIATRKFLLTYAESKEEFYPTLLPKLCLNRYYTAEGIRGYVQDSWKLIVGAEGKHLVAKYFQNVVDCYLQSATSTNLAERETACCCISELALKIDRLVFLPHAVPLLEALISCAQNESWAVRDASCLACGNFIVHYHEEAKPYLGTVYEILFRNLEDPIILLRQGAATSLGSIATTYGADALKVILPKLTAGLSAIELMKDRSSTEDLGHSTGASSGSGAAEAQGHTHPLVSNESDACAEHVPQCEFAVPGKTLVTSESLMRAFPVSVSPPAPVIPSPCLSCRKSKLPQPWHLGDGCLYLIGALTSVPEFKNDLETLVPLIIKVTEERSYPEHWTVHETFCKIVPLVAKAIGKKPFKEHLQRLLEPILYTVESMNPMTSERGRECLSQLGEFLGPNILRSRIELYDPKFVHLV